MVGGPETAGSVARREVQISATIASTGSRRQLDEARGPANHPNAEG